MRILVVADTHGAVASLLEAVRHAGHTDMLLHLGDGLRDCAALQGLYTGEVWKVRGNCDFTSADVSEEMLAPEGVSVYMAHGHLLDAKATMNRLWQKGRDTGADVVCFGHTHLPLHVRQGNLTLMNPGSLRYTRTYGLITARDGTYEIRFGKL